MRLSTLTTGLIMAALVVFPVRADQSVAYIGPGSSETDAKVYFTTMALNAMSECYRLWPDEGQSACTERQIAASSALWTMFSEAQANTPPRVFVVECLGEWTLGAGIEPFKTGFITNFPRALDCAQDRIAEHREAWSQ